MSEEHEPFIADKATGEEDQKGQDEKTAVEEVDDLPEVEEIYQGTEVSGLKGTRFFTVVFGLVTAQYFLSSWCIWLSTGDALPDEFKGAFHHSICGTVAITLVCIFWVGCYFVNLGPKELECIQVRTHWYWWVLWSFYIVSFGYAAGFIAANALLDVNFLMNIYLACAYGGLFGYALLCQYQQWYLRAGNMILAVMVVCYLSWMFFHYTGVTDATFAENIASVLSAGFFVILGVAYATAVLENGMRFGQKDYAYASIIFIVESLLMIYVLVRTLFVAPRQSFIKELEQDIQDSQLAKQNGAKETA